MTRSFSAVLLIILTTFFWGTNFNAGKIVVTHVMPLTASAIRFFIAAVVMLIICLPHIKSLPGIFKKNALMFILLGVIGVAGFNGLFLLGLKYTSPINGALIMGTNPLVTTLLAALILKERVKYNQKMGMLVSLVGVVIVITHGSWDKLVHLRVEKGDWIILIANICWASYGIFNRRYVKSSTALVTTTCTMVIGTLLLLLISFFEPQGYASALNQSWEVYLLILYMAVCGSALAYLFWNYGIEQLGPSRTSLFFNLVPVFTVTVSLLAGVPMNWMQILGGILVILGVFTSVNGLKRP